MDLSYQLLGLLNGVVPALLALLLLSRLPALPGFGIGLDRLRLRLRDRCRAWASPR